ncbi:MAG TPA: SCO1664 family protein, partial [Acidimicrobiales bacterium]|nr:SCO1664 family protein [Acidimicrobiales bacterium]
MAQLDDSPFRSRPPISTKRALVLLAEGEVDVLGRMPYSSNATFLVDVCHDGLLAQGVYKPHRGERPLWDFPSGLYHREAAAFELAEAMGWCFVPPTVVRDGPLGEGSLQLFIPAHFEQHYFTLREVDGNELLLQRLCVFDIIVNNTDRKSGHVLLGEDGCIWAIDNGLSFHAEFKLRTVI